MLPLAGSSDQRAARWTSIRPATSWITFLVFAIVVALGSSLAARAHESIAPGPVDAYSYDDAYGYDSHTNIAHTRNLSWVVRRGAHEISRPRAISAAPWLSHRSVAPIEGANFAQKTFSESFGARGSFAGQSIDDVAGQLRSGALLPKDVPINTIVRDGNTLMLNTRSAQALERVGIPRSAWNVIDATGDDLLEQLLSGQLSRNGLTSSGTPTVRPSGGG